MPPQPQGGMPTPPPTGDPSATGGTSPTQAGSVPMTPQHRQELLQMLASVKQGYGRWQTMKFGLQNKADAARQDELKKVFSLLQSKGVDLRDPKSVANYLQQLRQRDPKSAAAFEKALDYLLGKDYESNQTTDDTAGGSPLPEGSPQAGPALPEASVPGAS